MITTLPFDALARHLQAEVRGKTESSIVKRYARAMKNGATFPPLTVAEVNGALILVDGFHRVAAYESLGEWQAGCEVVPCANLEEAHWRAFKANMEHGQPLKAKAFRPAFRAFVRAAINSNGDGTLQSYRGIAEAIPSVSYSTVRRWMEVDFPEIYAAKAGDSDEAEGGLRPATNNYPDPPHDLTMQALGFLRDAKAIMEGVRVPELRGRVASQARELANTLELTGAGVASPDKDSVGF